MQTDKNGKKVEKSVSMHSHALERPFKRQIVTDPKSRNASHLYWKYVKQVNAGWRVYEQWY